MQEVTGVELAEIMNVSKEAVYQATRKGRIHRLPNGKYDLEQAQIDWKRKTHSRWGGKRLPRDRREPASPLHDERGSNPPEVNFWLKLVEQSYPHMADQFGRWGMRPAKVWNLLGMAFFLETCAVMRILEYPEDASLDDVFEYTPFTDKLRQCPHNRELEWWLVEQLKKDEGEELDRSNWE